MKFNAKLIGITQPIVGNTKATTAEELISYCARVSNPSNQENFKTAAGLLNYCMRNAHWSVFEMVSLVVEIEAPRDISRQILRHRSFSFQEFSQRYSDEIEFTERDIRLQDKKNRQNSVECNDDFLRDEWFGEVAGLTEDIQAVYKGFRDQDVAKEVARVILPEGLTMSRMYVNGTLRSWLHYLDVRTGNGTQLEHIWVAEKVREVIEPYFPSILVPKQDA